MQRQPSISLACVRQESLGDWGHSLWLGKSAWLTILECMLNRISDSFSGILPPKSGSGPFISEIIPEILVRISSNFAEFGKCLRNFS